MRLFWVRHGRMDFDDFDLVDVETISSLFNQEREASLCSRGRLEAQAVARHFERAAPLDAVYSSPQPRARETAEATAELLGLRTAVDDTLHELHAGRLRARSKTARTLDLVASVPRISGRRRIKVTNAALMPLYFRSWAAGKTEGGETRQELDQRIAALFALLRREHARDARVGLFAHGYLIFYVSAFVCRPRRHRLRVFKRPYVANGSITEMELGGDGAPRLVSFARTAHLGRPMHAILRA